jgi:anti-anti-sigma regulatory factor
LIGPWVAELRAVAAGSITIDLAGVRFVDSEGIHLLLALQSQGTRLQGASFFIQELLNISAAGP